MGVTYRWLGEGVGEVWLQPQTSVLEDDKSLEVDGGGTCTV